MNKKPVNLEEAVRLINHGPCVIVSVGDSEADNLFTVAWNMPVRKNPPHIAIESSMSHHSFSFIERTRELCINVPAANIADSVLAAGKISGADVEDKFTEVGLTRESSVIVKAPRVAEAVGHLECRVSKIIEFESSALIIAEVVAASADDTLFENGIWQPDKGEGMLHHLGGSAFAVSRIKKAL